MLIKCNKIYGPNYIQFWAFFWQKKWLTIIDKVFMPNLTSNVPLWHYAESMGPTVYTVAFKPTWTRRQFLVAPKDKSEKKDVTGPIYSIHCQGQTNTGQCEEFYIGKTKRSLKARFLEHRRSSSTSSEVYRHIHSDCPGQHIHLEKVNIFW